MGKKITRIRQDVGVDKDGLDLLRELAGYPIHSVMASRRQVVSDVTVIQRDQFGNIVGSTQRIEHTQIDDLDGQWSN